MKASTSLSVHRKWTSVRYFREHIEVGMLGVNLGVPARGHSSRSRDGKIHFTATGSDGVEFYTRKKMTVARY